MSSLEQRAVSAIHRQYDELPQKCKPRPLSEGGVAEWVPLSGIVLCRGDAEVQCVAIGTGMKCLPLSKVRTAHGNILHDWHAEVLAIRAFNHMLLKECLHLSSNDGAVSNILMRRDRVDDKEGLRQPYAIQPAVRIWMYCSEAPCGDASMELVMQKQDDATPWPVAHSRDEQGGLLGREGFSELGVVRRKPSRRDSPLTMSKSCSDKIALKQCTSLLSGLTARFVSPENAYIDTLILPTSQYVEEACERCFGINGRMKLLADKVWSGGFSFRPFRIATTDELFRFSQDAVSQQTTACKGSNISAVWTNSICETLINGVLQGRKQDDPRGASQVSRSRMLDLFFEICDMEAIVLMSSYRQASYRQLKTAGAEAEARSHVKAEVIENALSGWVANAEDELGLPGKG